VTTCKMRRQARQARRSGLQPMMVLNTGERFPETAGVILLRWAWRYRSELAPFGIADAIVLLTSSPEGATQYIDGDLRAAAPILRAAAGTLDFGRLTALILVGILHLIQDFEEPYRLVADLMNGLPRGSYLVVSHPASDIHAGQAEAQRRYNERVSTPQTLRTRDEVSGFFDGLELVPPGLVYVHEWRPDPGDVAPEGGVSAYGGVARKP
jgi:S-adenosyl methyltransferase